MTQLKQKPATYADLETVPSHLVAELLDGVLIRSPRLRMRQSFAQTALVSQLSGPFQKSRGGPGGWQIYSEPELHIGDNVAVPDIAGWQTDRAPAPETVKNIEMPDWACEILSPTTASYDRTVKFRLYHAAGIKHLWYLDPTLHTLEVFAHAPDAWMALTNFSNVDAVCAAPFDAISFQLADLWDD